MSNNNKFTVAVESFKPMRSNTLIGFVDIVVPELHLRIREATAHQAQNGGRWVGLPAKPQITRDGQVRRDERGKTAYSPVIEFVDRATRDAFSARVIEALLAAYPHAFEEVPA